MNIYFVIKIWHQMKQNIYIYYKRENLKRLTNYPNGTILLIQIICKNCDIEEKVILNKFKNNFIQKKDIGLEYFLGDKQQMIKII